MLDPYPTDGMMEMLAEARQLKVGEPAYDLFHQKYSLFTEFHSLCNMCFFVEYVKASLPVVLVGQAVSPEALRDFLDREANRMQTMATNLEMRLEYLLYFHCQLMQRWQEGRYVFIGHTKAPDGQREYMMYDLREDVAAVRQIQTAVCGNPGCGKTQEADGLSKCKTCMKAAYCSRECQKADWPFHKRYCKWLAEKDKL
jgi:MYND finger protein